MKGPSAIRLTSDKVSSAVVQYAEMAGGATLVLKIAKPIKGGDALVVQYIGKNHWEILPATAGLDLVRAMVAEADQEASALVRQVIEDDRRDREAVQRVEEDAGISTPQPAGALDTIRYELEAQAEKLRHWIGDGMANGFVQTAKEGGDDEVRVARALIDRRTAEVVDQIHAGWRHDDVYADRVSGQERERRRQRIEELKRVPRMPEDAKRQTPPVLKIPYLEGSDENAQTRKQWGNLLRRFAEQCGLSAGAAAGAAGLALEAYTNLCHGKITQPPQFWREVWGKLADAADRNAVPTIVSVTCTGCDRNMIHGDPVAAPEKCPDCEGGTIVVNRLDGSKVPIRPAPVAQTPKEEASEATDTARHCAEKYWRTAQACKRSKKPRLAKAVKDKDSGQAVLPCCELSLSPIAEGQLKYTLKSGRHAHEWAVDQLAECGNVDAAEECIRRMRGPGSGN